MPKNNSGTYSYYFDNIAGRLYDFLDKERCVKNYIAYMLDRTQKIFEYEGLPDTIPKRMLEFLLQINGFACFAKDGADLYAFYGGLGGPPDPYYRPTLCVVANPALKLSKTFEIDKDCVIVRNDALLVGLMPMFRRYATAMMENDITFRMAVINTRVQALLTAPDDNTKKAADKFLKDIEDGKLGAIQVNEFLEGLKAQPVTESYRTFTDLIEYQQYLKASWYNEIGLNANYNMKREKLSTTESQMNNDALLPLVDQMLESRQKGLEQVNEMFGTNISVRFTSSWEKLLKEIEGELNGESNQLESGSDSDTGEILRQDDDAENVDADIDTGSETEVSDPETGDEGESEITEMTEGNVTEADVTVEINVNVDTGEESEVETDESDGSVPKDDDE